MSIIESKCTYRYRNVVRLINIGNDLANSNGHQGFIKNAKVREVIIFQIV